MIKHKKSKQSSGLLGDITSMGVGSMVGASMQIGLGSMAATPGIPAGAAASLASGSAGITNMTAQFPVMGTLSGMKPLFGTLKSMSKKAKL
jgi:hypothetical protein